MYKGASIYSCKKKFFYHFFFAFAIAFYMVLYMVLIFKIFSQLIRGHKMARIIIIEESFGFTLGFKIVSDEPC